MSVIEAYLFLFFDSLISYLILPISELFVLPVMKIMGGYNGIIICVTVLFAFILAILINWAFGYLLHSLKKSNISENDNIIITNAYVGNFIFVMQLFAYLPVVGGAFVVLAGYANIRIVKVMAMAILGWGINFYILFGRDFFGF